MSDNELVLRPGATGRGTKRKREADQKPSTRLQERFEQAYLRRWRHPPLMNPGRDRKLLNELVATWGEEVVGELIDLFFKTRDSEVARCRSYNVVDFRSLAPKLMRMKYGDRGVPSPASARNVTEIKRAMGEQADD